MRKPASGPAKSGRASGQTGTPNDSYAARLRLALTMTSPTCSCSRIRLSTEGRLYLCLFATEGYDLRALLRGGHSDLEIANAIAHIWQGRAVRYSELRGQRAPDDSATPGARRVEMSYIGG